jgi:hypothetical protein
MAKMQRNQSKILRMITTAPWYVTNQTLRDDLKVPFIKDIIQERSIKHHGKLGNYSNTTMPPLLEEATKQKTKAFWPVDLIDG